MKTCSSTHDQVHHRSANDSDEDGPHCDRDARALFFELVVWHGYQLFQILSDSQGKTEQ
jgi:hypothetical protein